MIIKMGWYYLFIYETLDRFLKRVDYNSEYGFQIGYSVDMS